MRFFFRYLLVLPGICLLLFLVAGMGEHIHGRVLQLGPWIWPEYTTLREQATQPSCDPHRDIEQAIQLLKNKAEQEQASAEADGFATDGFGDIDFNETAARRSLQASQQACQQQHQQYADVEAQRTATVNFFSAIEKKFGLLVAWIFDGQRVLLMLMVLSCAAYASVHGEHIAFRKPRSRLDHTVNYTLQLITSLLLLYSTCRYQWDVSKEGLEVLHPLLVKIVLAGLIFFCFTNLYQLLRWIQATTPSEEMVASWSQALLTVPLYAYMGLIAGGYFFLVEQHPAGLAIFFSQLLEQADVFLKIAVYIWLGMLIKNNRLGEAVFAFIHSLHLPTIAMLVLVLAFMAFPTAYTGASGVVILAFGAVIYQQLRLVGTRRSLALATTAMSGSVGVILSPCLLVVLIAALNKEVITDELYGWGLWVFALTLVVFAAILKLCLSSKLSPDSTTSYPDQTTPYPTHPTACPTHTSKRNWQQVFKEGQNLASYGLVLVGSLLLYSWIFAVQFDEISAPIILPVAIIALLVFEKFRAKRHQQITPAHSESHDGHSHLQPDQPIFRQFLSGMEAATPHIGSLIMLMGLSFAVGGVFSRSGLLELLPMVWENPLALMLILVGLLIVLGMIMEPFGAIVLVSTTIAPLAYQNGIHPAHFWMTALVAFELGYLTPPIALNHLLTQQVVGNLQPVPTERPTGWQRYEQFLLPIITMTIVLILVAFLPLLWL